MGVLKLGIGLTIYFGVIAFVLGTVFGSFLNCAAWRIAHQMSFLKGRSICPHCRHELGAKDLVPIISFLAFKGRCRYCGDKISPRYPLTEAVFGAMSVILFLVDGITPLYIRDFAFVCCLFCLSLVDLESFEIPDGTLIISVLIWAAYLPFAGWSIRDVMLHVAAGVAFLLGFLAVSLVMDKALGRESMGGGDIKLIGVMGLYLGFIGTLFAAIIACVLGLVMALYHNRNESESKPIPFGPFLSIAAYLMLLFGNGLIDWYIHLLL